ncbi:major facilitator superfamily multidrug resistance transporter QacA [Ameyamaea chiangmaiensis NBRC 103196]|uniref:MFS transporter n=1 Tax=Ameyamaea chiangmaiensis TaxID=442969 RepID=A0A850P8P2_9PROT|nr:MFS transporter [Ameyamaea chiangmaiensis]MBS4074009.1 MFS transporter [Ameyamaea chiangmaiensis]NVN40957.1 MFS transporter [Ameyamaea chiangmaiensis]GBQ67625.1 major facilitator superfamily multidrug resistance transporter QacA [Ameyamaea chiangmaiensis NBRC 103196]
MTRHPIRPHVVLLTCCLSLFIVMMDVTIINIVLPSIHRAFGGPLATLQWVVDAYSLVVASGLMLGGALADRFGRRRIFMTGLVMFSIGSVLCGLAWDAVTLVLARAVQGVGGAMLNPVALSIISSVFREPVARARAIGVWGAMSGVALGVGPLVGGVLTASVGWRAVFWVNVPIGLAAWTLSRLFIPESRAERPRPIDVPGQLTAALVQLCVIAGLIEWPRHGADGLVVALCVGAASSAIGFVVVERRVRAPMIDLASFRSLPLVSALLTAICVFAIFGGFLFLNTLYLQDVRGLTPLRAGLCTVPAAVGIVGGAVLSGRLLGRFGARVPLLVSAFGLATGLLVLLVVGPATPWAVVFSAYGLSGLGYGMANAPITNAAIGGLPPERSGVAAGMASTSRQIGASLGVAVSGSLIASATTAGAMVAASHTMWRLSLGLVGVMVVLACAAGMKRPPAGD